MPPPSQDDLKRRLFVPKLKRGEIQIDADDLRYLRTVLRLGLGAEIELFDGRGNRARATMSTVERSRAILTVDAPAQDPPPACELTVAVGTPKGDRSDWLVEKLTELGVSRILWLESQRGVVKPKTGGGRTKRWSRLVEAATRQCGRSRLTEIAGPVPFESLLRERADARILADPGANHLISRARTQGKALVAIGPEGGFSEEELVAAGNAGYTRARLVEWTLRVETAAIAAAALILGT